MGVVHDGREVMPKNEMTTIEGKKRFDETDGYYISNFQPGTPCTCEADCPDPCKGGCGCLACTEAYGDFLSSE